MPIKCVSAPAASTEKFRDWVSQRKPRGKVLLRGNKPEENLPHKVFHVSLDDIASEKGFANANQVSWRHIHTDSSGHHYAVEIRLGASKDKHHFQEVHHGLMVDELKALITALEDMEELKGEEYELAYLRIFAIKISALWLRAAERDNDYFIPLSPCFYGLIPGKLYAVPEFLEKAKEAVRIFVLNAKRLSADNLLGG
jgi:hypothetical protein